MASKQQQSTGKTNGNGSNSNQKQSKEYTNKKQVEKANSESSLSSNSESKDNSVASKNDWTCVVCCQKVPGPSRKELYAIGPCEHPVCYECSTKMRLLCEQNECPICRQEILKVSLSLFLIAINNVLMIPGRWFLHRTVTLSTPTLIGQV